MTVQETKKLMIEYALTHLVAESRSFKRYYNNTECFQVEYELFDDYGVAYIVEEDGKTLLAEIRFEDVADVLRNGLDYTNKLFMPLVGKYGLHSPHEDVTWMPLEVIESEEQSCQEMN